MGVDVAEAVPQLADAPIGLGTEMGAPHGPVSELDTPRRIAYRRGLGGLHGEA